MHDFMQSLQIRCPVAATSALSTVMIASAPIEWPATLAAWNSEIFSSNGQPASVTPNALRRNAPTSPFGAFSRSPFEHESLLCLWHQMQ